MSDLRGRTTRERRLAEKVAREWAERRAAQVTPEAVVDLDRASAEAEVELAVEREAAAGPGRPSRAGSPDRTAGQSAGRGATTTVRRRPATPATRAAGPVLGDRSARRLPDLSSLPPLLTSTGAFEALRERLGPSDPAPGPRGRHAGVTAVPHGAKSYLAAALAGAGERLVWIARDAEIGDRVAEELQAWLGDAGSVAILEPRTALAYERSELVPDETAARVAALAAWRSGRARVLVASVQ
ncbi:MAG TPA: hypothetical protein VEY67_12160, partial [Candidatus Dormibacteraeota bacterium]|nr:hypothetical protein [Candidatus Dormibacteraeota bacterium]